MCTLWGLSSEFCGLSAEQPELDEVETSTEEAASAIRDSCLLPYLELELAQASFTDMGNRHAALTPLCNATLAIKYGEELQASQQWVMSGAHFAAGRLSM